MNNNNNNNKESIFKQKLFEKHGNNIINLEPYINNHTKIKFYCKECKYEWYTKPMYLTRNKNTCGCPNCYKIRSNIKINDINSLRNFIFKETNNEYILISDKYINNLTKVEIKHTKCNKNYFVRPNDFQQGYRCPYCSHGHTRKTNEEFKKEIYNLYGDEYELITEYKTCKDYVCLKHIKCGNSFNVLPRNFLSNKTRCPYCYVQGIRNYTSKNVDYLFNYFKENGYTVKIEKYFKDLKYKKYLRFDFYLEELNLFIEYDGEQHFKPIGSIFTAEKLKEINKRDILKNEYCLKNNINLIRLDKYNFKYIDSLLNDIKNKRSTTIEKYNIYSILDFKINDNHKYYIE